MSKDFGNTWWGQRWLESLSDIDYSNRLPRGKTYARAGKVGRIIIKDNIIEAKVSGRRATPYKVTIIIPPFFEKEIEELISKILDRPMLLSKLLKRELDPDILNIADSIGLKVFPERWTDLKMMCHCPDWAVPCKHLASVIYMFSREIDNNPFLVFEMHRVDLIKELKNRGIDLSEHKKSEIPDFKKQFQKMPKAMKKEYDLNKAYKRVDLSELHDSTETLVKILPDSPPFFPDGNFRDLYGRIISKTAKKAMRYIKKSKDLFNRNEEVKDLNKRSKIIIEIDKNSNCFISGENHNIENTIDLIRSLLEIKPDFLLDYEPSIAILHTCVNTALHLIAHGAITPMIYKLKDKNYIINWLPACIDASVRDIIKELEGLMIPGIFYLKNIKKSMEIIPEPEYILSIFITEIIKNIIPEIPEGIIPKLFFTHRSHDFMGVGERSLPGGIKVWLDRHHIHNEEFKPVLHIKETEKDIFLVDISIEELKQDSIPIPLKEVFLDGNYKNNRFKILQTISLLSPFVPGLDSHINKKALDSIYYDLKNLGDFIMEMLPIIKLLDIKVVMPRSLNYIFRPKPTIQIDTISQKADKKYLNLCEILNFNWKIALGDNVVSEKEFSKIIKNTTGLLKFKDEYIFISQDDLHKVKKHFASARPLSPMELLQSAILEEYENAPIQMTDAVKKAIKEIMDWDKLDKPEKVNAELRPYQERGYSWMYHNSKLGFGSIIADDMGLGKTLQVIALLQRFKDEGYIDKDHKALIIVPTGLLINWQNELEKFAPNLNCDIHHGTSRNIKDCRKEIILTSYGIARSDAPKLKKYKWAIIIIDEAQHIKNYKTGQARAVKGLSGDVRIAMSGTPVENRLSEFWSIMDFVNKDYLGSFNTFEDKYAVPIQKYNDKGLANKFKKVTSPFLMRRLKTDKKIISDLPEKIEINQYVKLSKKQAALYESTVSVALQEIENIEAKDSNSLFKRQGLVLQMMLALKQICNHPANFLKDNNIDSALSGKTLMLLELLDIIRNNQEKVLIFTQFREMGEILLNILSKELGDRPLFYHGGCSLKSRHEMVEKFQNNRADKIFILSLKAAGTGLNLTAANHVIHYDLWWNPAVENQATDRAFRIGQKKNVEVHRFITKSTFEEKIDQMIQSKKNLADLTVSVGENWIGKLSNKELNSIFRS